MLYIMKENSELFYAFHMAVVISFEMEYIFAYNRNIYSLKIDEDVRYEMVFIQIE